MEEDATSKPRRAFNLSGSCLPTPPGRDGPGLCGLRGQCTDKVLHSSGPAHTTVQRPEVEPSKGSRAASGVERRPRGDVDTDTRP